MLTSVSLDKLHSQSTSMIRVIEKNLKDKNTSHTRKATITIKSPQWNAI